MCPNTVFQRTRDTGDQPCSGCKVCLLPRRAPTQGAKAWGAFPWACPPAVSVQFDLRSRLWKEAPGFWSSLCHQLLGWLVREIMSLIWVLFSSQIQLGI